MKNHMTVTVTVTDSKSELDVIGLVHSEPESESAMVLPGPCALPIVRVCTRYKYIIAIQVGWISPLSM